MKSVNCPHKLDLCVLGFRKNVIVRYKMKADEALYEAKKNGRDRIAGKVWGA
ncbi:hypothetical protein [Baileyella intestinalis]|uniref:hypothetical protein n=1 Tax=Baileyella intestinalis TaxID=2606709 RepID=UPI0022E20FE6|nr:hypothetical protein [Baileyella intestinalis]